MHDFKASALSMNRTNGSRAHRRDLRAARTRQGAIARREVRQRWQLYQTWGKNGRDPSDFNVPHSLVFDARGSSSPTAAISAFRCSTLTVTISAVEPRARRGLFITHSQHIWLAATPARSWLDLNGKCSARLQDRTGQDARQIWRAHYIAVNARDDLRCRYAELARAEVYKK